MLPVERVDAEAGGALAARIIADTDQVRLLAGIGLVQSRLRRSPRRSYLACFSAWSSPSP